MLKRTACAFLGLAALAAPASGGEFGARGEFWRSDLSGNVKAQSGSIPATRLSFPSLGMDTTETFPAGEIFMRWGQEGRHRLSLRYMEQSYRGETTLSQSVTFKTFVFQASTVLSSRLAFQDVELRYGWEFWQGQALPAALGRPSPFWGIFGAKALTVRAELSSPAKGSVEETQTVPVPVLGAGGRWRMTRRLALEAELAGLILDVSDVSATFYEISALLRCELNPHVAILAGWRAWHIAADIDSSTTKFDFNATLKGPFVGVEGRF